jgi:nuclear migration protein JNM1
MAAKNKYAGLIDVDDSTPEIYETPGLTDDASTIQTNTVPTGSPTASEDGDDDRLDRQRIHQDSARRRFEPSLVNAKDVNFSDTVASGERQSYRTRSRRRRRAYDDESGSESDEETLQGRIARLKREAEEVRIMLAKRDEAEDKEETDGNDIDELDELLRGLKAPSASARKSEEAFLASLSQKPPPTTTETSQPQPPTHPSTNAAIASFSDRLSALETTLGLHSIDPSTTSILPTLSTLTTQLDTLTSLLSPTPNTSSSTISTSNSQLNLDTLSTRLATLTHSASTLTQTRKSALLALQDLHDSRQRLLLSNSRSSSKPGTQTQSQLNDISATENALHSNLFLSEQSAKISALYQVLPTITKLQPLLPIVLERLRSLSVIHTGAGEARGELEDLVSRQEEMKREVGRWMEAVEKVEGSIAEMRQGMREDVEGISGVVGGLEERMKALKG